MVVTRGGAETLRSVSKKLRRHYLQILPPNFRSSFENSIKIAISHGAQLVTCEDHEHRLPLRFLGEELPPRLVRLSVVVLDDRDNMQRWARPWFANHDRNMDRRYWHQFCWRRADHAFWNMSTTTVDANPSRQAGYGRLTAEGNVSRGIGETTS